MLVAQCRNASDARALSLSGFSPHHGQIGGGVFHFRNGIRCWCCRGSLIGLEGSANADAGISRHRHNRNLIRRPGSSDIITTAALLHFVDGVAKGDVSENAILHIAQHFLSEWIAAKPHAGIAPLLFAIDISAFNDANYAIRVVIKQQRCTIIQAAQISRIHFVAENLIAKIASNRKLRAKWEFISAIFNLIKRGGLSALMLANARHRPLFASSFLEQDRIHFVIAQPLASLLRRVFLCIKSDGLQFAFAFLNPVDKINATTTRVIFATQVVILARLGKPCCVFVWIGTRLFHFSNLH